ncbi:BMP family ABC transporter substrate-binding protein [Desulfovibrio inopinatus]|uniref:BMP family ABC transporter substrate-binding protein n=1 Tax=Desulfovibrio inopinatus TaxID=102109 RepID=UPI000405EB8C|nr:BMP family ABC transporter substrate-binding protein [Desulfovibrio inopinatus]
MKRLLCSLIFLAVLCANSSAQEIRISEAPPVETQNLVIGLVRGVGSKKNSAFNLMQEGGVFLARTLYGVPFLEETPESPATCAAAMERVIARGANLIIAGGGFRMIDAVDDVARLHDDVRFVLLDCSAKTYLHNVSSVTFRQNEASYLAGAVAAWGTQSGKVGVLGALDAPVINDFILGFEAGAKKIRHDIQLDIRFIGTQYPEIIPFIAIPEAHAMADDMYADGCDVIFAVASAANAGVFQSAKSHNRFVIGVDSDQDFVAPGLVLTSVMKRLDIAILHTIASARDGTLSNVDISLGLKENGVSITPMTYTWPLFSELELRQLKMFALKIKQGVINVPSAVTAATVAP